MARIVKVSTVALFRPAGFCSIEEHMKRAEDAVDEALCEKPDIILLPEAYPVFESTQEEIIRSSEIYQKLNERIGKKAKAGCCYIVNNILRKQFGKIYNTAFLLDRNGHVCFEYSKTHLAAFENKVYQNDAGNELPVYETDFGKIGIMICMDIHFPEVSRVLALKGAEIIFWPTQAYGPTDEILMMLLRTRAFDNQTYCVAANYSQQPFLPGKNIGRACIVSIDGNIIADTGNRPGIASSKIDLDAKHILDWSYTNCCDEMTRDFPDWRTMFKKLRRPELYEEICKINNEF